MNVSEINKEFYDRAYSTKNVFFLLLHPYISFDQQSKTKRNLKILKPLLHSKKGKIKILDYGFGLGTLLIKIPQKNNLYGCEISDEAIFSMQKIANILDKQITLCKSEKLQITIKSIKFDVICCSHVLEHVEEDEALLKMLSKYLNDDGNIIINLPINEVWEDPKHIRRYTIESASDLINRCELHINEIYEADRLTAFLLKNEQLGSLGNFSRLIFRLVRLILAIIPLWLVEVIDYFLPQKYKNQQMIMLVRKKL